MRATNREANFLPMVKSLCNALILTVAALFLTACPKNTAPTPSSSAMIGYDGDLIPSSNSSEDWGSELESRDPNQGFGEDNTYTDANGKTWTMVPGQYPSVYFGFDSVAISATERGKLQLAANHLLENPGDALLIEGHCDWYGTTEYNLALGDRRANSARDYLTTLGVDNSRVETLSKGSLDSISGLSKAASSQDRRVDIIVLQ